MPEGTFGIYIVGGRCKPCKQKNELIRKNHVNQPAAEAGLTLLDAGGDFADGVIAYEGSWLGAEAFVSFDKKAVKLMEARGTSVRLLS